MKAGRELDTLVAEKVMGWTFRTYPEGVCPNVKHWHCGEQYVLMKPFSTDIAAAWQVVEKLREKWAIELHGRDGAWSCLVEEGDEVTAHFIATAESSTAPLAICLAALKACGVEVDSPQ